MYVFIIKVSNVNCENQIFSRPLAKYSEPLWFVFNSIELKLHHIYIQANMFNLKVSQIQNLIWIILHFQEVKSFLSSMLLKDKQVGKLKFLQLFLKMIHTSALPSNWNLGKFFALTGPLGRGQVHMVKKYKRFCVKLDFGHYKYN